MAIQLNLFGWHIDTRQPLPETAKQCHRDAHPAPHKRFHDGSGAQCTACEYDFEARGWFTLAAGADHTYRDEEDFLHTTPFPEGGPYWMANLWPGPVTEEQHRPPPNSYPPTRAELHPR